MPRTGLRRTRWSWSGARRRAAGGARRLRPGRPGVASAGRAGAGPGRGEGPPVELVDCGPDAAATVSALVHQGTCDAIVLSTPPEHHARWHRHGLTKEIQGLGIPVTVIPPDPTGWSYAHGFPDDWVRIEVGPLT